MVCNVIVILPAIWRICGVLDDSNDSVLGTVKLTSMHFAASGNQLTAIEPNGYERSVSNPTETYHSMGEILHIKEHSSSFDDTKKLDLHLPSDPDTPFSSLVHNGDWQLYPHKQTSATFFLHHTHFIRVICFLFVLFVLTLHESNLGWVIATRTLVSKIANPPRSLKINIQNMTKMNYQPVMYVRVWFKATILYECFSAFLFRASKSTFLASISVKHKLKLFSRCPEQRPNFSVHSRNPINICITDMQQ